MPIDYLEFYSGQCFGAVTSSDDFIGGDCIGDDIDVEIDEHISSELFGGMSKSSRKAKMGKQLDKLKGMMHDLLRKKRKGKVLANKISILKNQDGLAKSKTFQLRVSLNRIKSEMKELVGKITSYWRTRERAFKKYWAKRHEKSEHWKTPAAFIAKHGPHSLQAK